eukprot:scaffold19425_cov129-Isochrysis_galbana.AAC.7
MTERNLDSSWLSTQPSSIEMIRNGPAIPMMMKKHVNSRASHRSPEGVDYSPALRARKRALDKGGVLRDDGRVRHAACQRYGLICAFFVDCVADVVEEDAEYQI